MALNRKKLNEIATCRSDRAIQLAQQRRANRDWLRMSQDIALSVYHYMQKTGITQRELAKKMDVSAAYVGKLLKGSENLTLETICKLQNAIGESLVSVSRPYSMYIITSITLSHTYNATRNTVCSDTFSDVCTENNNTFTVAQRATA